MCGQGTGAAPLAPSSPYLDCSTTDIMRSKTVLNKSADVLQNKSPHQVRLRTYVFTNKMPRVPRNKYMK